MDGWMDDGWMDAWMAGWLAGWEEWKYLLFLQPLKINLQKNNTSKTNWSKNHT